MLSYHKKVVPATFHRCLLECDLPIETKKMARMGKFISINMHADENILVLSEPAHYKVNERLLSIRVRFHIKVSVASMVP